MPTVLLQVDAKSNATGVLAGVERALAKVERGLLAVNAAAAGGVLNSHIASFAKLTSGADSSAGAIAKLTREYRDMAAAADAAARAAAKLHGGGGGPPADPSGTKTKESGGFGLGSAVRMAAGIAGYQAAYMAGSALTGSLSANAKLSALGGQTAATTTMNAADIPKLEAYATKLAGSGTQPFDAQTILTGLYNFMSQGFSMSQAMAMNNTAVGMAQVGGMPDTTTSGTALLAMGNSFGWGKNMDQSSQSYANYLQTGTNIGAYSMADMARALPNAGLAQLGRVGFNPQFALTAFAEGSYAGVSAEETAQNLKSLGAGINKPQASARRAAAILGMDLSPEGIAKAGGAQQWFDTFEQHLATLPKEKQGQMLARVFPNQSAAAMVSELFSGTGPRSMQNVYSQMGQGQVGKGSFATALAIEGSTPGQKLLSTEAQLSQAFNTLTTGALPGLTSAAALAASVLATITAPGGNPLENVGKWVANLSSGADKTMSHFMNPLDPAFLKIDAARNAAGQDVLRGHLHENTGGEMHGRTGESRGRESNPFAWYGGLAALSPGLEGASAAAVPAASKTPGWYGGLAPLTPSAESTAAAMHGRTGESTGKGTLPAPQNFSAAAQAYLGTTGRGTTTADMARFEGNLRIAMKQGQGVNTVESALGLAIKALKADPALTGQQRTNKILDDQKLVAHYEQGLAKAAAKAAPAPFHAPNPTIGGFEAGQGATSVRFGGGRTDMAQYIAKLEHQIAVDNAEIKSLLARIAGNTTHTPATASTSLLSGTGANRIRTR